MIKIWLPQIWKKYIYHISYAIPIGCTTGEYGKYKNMKVDGIIGLNNDKGSFTVCYIIWKLLKKNSIMHFLER